MLSLDCTVKMIKNAFYIFICIHVSWPRTGVMINISFTLQDMDVVDVRQTCYVQRQQFIFFFLFLNKFRKQHNFFFFFFLKKLIYILKYQKNMLFILLIFLSFVHITPKLFYKQICFICIICNNL